MIRGFVQDQQIRGSRNRARGNAIAGAGRLERRRPLSIQFRSRRKPVNELMRGGTFGAAAITASASLGFAIAISPEIVPDIM